MKKEGLRILYLCEKQVYLHRTSRVRFHAVKAIAKIAHVIWSGPGWENWDNTKTLSENIALIYPNFEKPDLIFCYKPYTIRGFSDCVIPKCVSYNEMDTLAHPRSYTIKEILDNKIDLVICHHKNEMLYPEFRDLPCKMVNISHCADESVFHDYQLPKDIDVLLVGAIHPEQYPLRSRFYELTLKMRTDPQFSAYRMGVWKHPGGMCGNAYDDSQVITYAKAINRAKICLTCSGRSHSRYGKYVEIPACRSFLMGDLPDEDHEFFQQFMGVINPEDSNTLIKEKIFYYLNQEAERKALTDKGYTLAHASYTQRDYAEKFLRAILDYLQTPP